MKRLYKQVKKLLQIGWCEQLYIYFVIITYIEDFILIPEKNFFCCGIKIEKDKRKKEIMGSTHKDK